MINRREFIEKGAATLAAVSIPGVAGAQSKREKVGNRADEKKRLVLVGTGGRGSATWIRGVLSGYSDRVNYVALCDINIKRCEAVKKSVSGLSDAKCYHADCFDQMIEETRPDFVIVTSTDAFHEKYVVRALELGCDVICEKPLAIDAGQCQRIVEAEKRSGKRLIVTFNLRYSAEMIEIKKILQTGVLGKILTVDFHEYLDQQHGASYFRRWHKYKRFSGSLLLTKATHHFDVVNWFVESDPIVVQAMGKLSYYGHNHPFEGKNCRSCEHTSKCEYYWDMTKDANAMMLYGNCESEDGYLRDGCVWDSSIDIYDSSTVQVEYKNGVQFTYMMNSYLPYEGQTICISCEKGRLDVRCNARQGWDAPDYEFRISKLGQPSQFYPLKAGAGGHGGADNGLQDDIFLPSRPEDTLGQRAGSKAGIMSSIIGIAARRSIESHQKVEIDSLIEYPSEWYK